MLLQKVIKSVCVCVWGGGGAAFLITFIGYSLGAGVPPPVQKFNGTWYFHALRRLMVQSEPKVLIELLTNSLFTVAEIQYCMKNLIYGANMHIQKVGGEGGGPLSYTTVLSRVTGTTPLQTTRWSIML